MITPESESKTPGGSRSAHGLESMADKSHWWRGGLSRTPKQARRRMDYGADGCHPGIGSAILFISRILLCGYHPRPGNIRQHDECQQCVL